MLELSYPPAHVKTETRQVTTTLLAVARSSGAKYEKPDGSPLAIDRDFFGARRSATLPTAGPFENPGAGLLKLRLR